MGMRTSQGIDGLPKEITLRAGCERDLPYVRDVDLKSSHYPWPAAAWEAFEAPACKLCVALYRAEPVGFVVYRINEGDVDILRLGVKPSQRGKGIGGALLDSVLSYARAERCLRMTMTVAEIYCLPGHPDDVSQWLSQYGFRTVLPVAKDYAFMYGDWVDGFCFVYTLGDSK